MLKPRLASFAFLLMSSASFFLSRFVISQVHSGLAMTVAVITLLASVAASYFAFFGVIASLLAKPTDDGYFLPKDNVLVRFCVKIGFLDLSKKTSFCGYSATLAVGSFIVLAVVGIIVLFGFALLQDPMKTLVFIGKLIVGALAVVGGIVVYALSIVYLSRRAPWIAALLTFSVVGGLIYLAVKEKPPEPIDLKMMAACIASLASIIVAGIFGYRFLKSLSFYPSICPKYEPVPE